MQTRNRILDDLARVGAGALGVAAGMRREAEDLLKARFAAVLGAQGLVGREEFDAVKAMVAKARAENAKLAERLAKLEAALVTLNAKGRAAKPKPARRRLKVAAAKPKRRR